jgi:hypothetical protein
MIASSTLPVSPRRATSDWLNRNRNDPAWRRSFIYASLCTVSIENAGRQIATYSAPLGVL